MALPTDTEATEERMPKGNNGNGDDHHPRLSLPPNPDDDLTPDTWQDAFKRINERTLSLYTSNGEIIGELSSVSARSERVERKVDAMIDDIRAYSRKVDSVQQAQGHMRERIASLPNITEEDAATPTGRHELKEILQAHDLLSAKEIVAKQKKEIEDAKAEERRKAEAADAEQKKKKSEWRTAAIGFLFLLLAAATERIVDAIQHMGH